MLFDRFRKVARSLRGRSAPAAAVPDGGTQVNEDEATGEDGGGQAGSGTDTGSAERDTPDADGETGESDTGTPVTDTEGTTDPDAVAADIADRYDPDLDRLEWIYEDVAIDEVDTAHLTSVETDPATVREGIDRSTNGDIGPTTFVQSHEIAIDALVEATFEHLGEEVDADGELDVTAEALRSGLHEILTSVRTGVSEYEQQTAADRDDHHERHEETVALVEELQDTMAALQDGNLDARAEFDSDGDVDETLLAVVDSLNDLASQFEDAASGVSDQTTELASSIDQASVAAGQVEQRVTKQTELLGEASREIQGVSASMEQIAATSDQVASAAQQALDSADEGLTASEEVKEVTDDLTERSEDLVDSVSSLEERLDDIEEIVEVISEVAEQTNLLALNANIEAARAGEAGAGFSVVADEVKSLAEETSGYTEEISANIERIQQQAAETVTAVDDSHEQISHAEDRVNESLTALQDIAENVEEAADGIQEVAHANDDQAATIEEITTSIEEVHDHAREAEEAAGNIVGATERQTQAVNELYDSVNDLVNR